MSQEAEQPQRHGRSWLDHPEVIAAFQHTLEEILPESDRGAVLIAADMVSNHLDETFARLCPDFMRPKLRQLISYPGAASSLSGKADIAALNGWIDESSYRALGLLRRIRNEAAHSNKSFQLKDQMDRLNQMLNLGEGVPISIHNMAGEILLTNYFHALRQSGESLVDDLGENPFDSVDKISAVLEKNPNWSKPLEERVPRLKLGIGVCLMLSLMTLMREKREAEFHASQRVAPSAP